MAALVFVRNKRSKFLPTFTWPINITVNYGRQRRCAFYSNVNYNTRPTARVCIYYIYIYNLTVESPLVTVIIHYFKLYVGIISNIMYRRPQSSNTIYYIYTYASHVLRKFYTPCTCACSYMFRGQTRSKFPWRRTSLK